MPVGAQVDDTGERLATLREQLDTAHQMTAMIGAGGGSIQTVSAGGVIIKLVIPPGALTQDTLIKVTPLSVSPLPDSSQSLLPGVKFEPEGLQFALPATLTLNFSATPQVITNKDSIFLLTSLVTTLPLFGTVNPGGKILTAWLFHFSAIQPGLLGPKFADLAAWADPILSSTRNATFSELASAAALAAQCMLGGSSNCNLTQLAQRAQASFNALVSATCSSSTANPTDQALEHLLQLETLGQALGLDTTAVRNCEKQVFRALIIDYGSRALVNPTDTNLARLLNAAVRAQQLGFDDLDILALQKLDAALRSLLAEAQQICPADSTSGKNLLNRAIAYASAVAAFGIDAGLENDLQQAINNCGGVFLGASGTYRQCFDDTGCQAPSSDQTWDLTRQDANGDMELRLTQPSGCGTAITDVLLIHATVSSNSIQGQVTGNRFCYFGAHCQLGCDPNIYDFYTGHPLIGWTFNSDDGTLTGRIDQGQYRRCDNQGDNCVFTTLYWAFNR